MNIIPILIMIQNTSPVVLNVENPKWKVLKRLAKILGMYLGIVKMGMLLFFLLPSYSSELELKIGASLNQSFRVVKYASTSMNGSFFNNTWLVHRIESGFWTDATEGDSSRGSMFTNYGIGLNAASSGGFYGKFFIGPGLITNPDQRLGGPFQFFNDLEFGVQGTNHLKLGVSLKHISSAGIYSPNVGRDFITFKVGFPF